jgi:hypothetical protein
MRDSESADLVQTDYFCQHCGFNALDDEADQLWDVLGDLPTG